MIRKFLVISMLFIIVLCSNLNQSFALEGFVGFDLAEYKSIVNTGFEDVKKGFLDNIVNDLYKDASGNTIEGVPKSLKTEMIIPAQVYVDTNSLREDTKTKEYTYTVSIYKMDGNLLQNFKDMKPEDINSRFGGKENIVDGNFEDSITNKTWNIFFKVKCEMTYVGDQYTLKLKAIDAERDKSKISINPEDVVEPKHEEENPGAIQTAEKLGDSKKEFSKDPVGTIEKWILGALRTIFDWIQGGIDIFKNMDDGLDFSDFEIMYSYSRLSQESGTSSEFKNGYTNVSEPSEASQGENSTWQPQIRIDNKYEKFTKDETNIPVITVELYNMAKGNINFFDVNFLNPEKSEHSHSWNVLRDFATNIMHITLYVGIVILLSILIMYGIKIIYNSTNLKKEIDKNFSNIGKNKTPKEVVNYKQGMKRYVISLILIVGIIAFMAICIFLNDVAIEILQIGNQSSNESEEFPIRVTVDDVYSFSTNPIGYYRFMAASNDLSDKRMYTLIYILLVSINGILAAFMVARVIQMYVLGIIGPIIVAAYAAKLEKHMPMDIETWAKRYFMLSAIQICISILYKVIEYTAIT